MTGIRYNSEKMIYIYKGKKRAKEKLQDLSVLAKSLIKKGKKPRLVSFVIGDNKEGLIYSAMKKNAAMKIGAVFEVECLQEDAGKTKIIREIKNFNNDDKVDGIMVQLPLPESYSVKEKHEIINSIAKHKDVDGMREDSFFTAPVVKAVMIVLSDSAVGKESLCVVVGGGGFVGKKIIKELKKTGFGIVSVNTKTKNIKKKTKKADVLISATGRAGLIEKDMVKKGAVVIDLGYPEPDVSKGVYKKASFITPVPEGIGPLTIACLLENCIIALKSDWKEK